MPGLVEIIATSGLGEVILVTARLVKTLVVLVMSGLVEIPIILGLVVIVIMSELGGNSISTELVILLVFCLNLYKTPFIPKLGDVTLITLRLVEILSAQDRSCNRYYTTIGRNFCHPKIEGCHSYYYGGTSRKVKTLVILELGECHGVLR